MNVFLKRRRARAFTVVELLIIVVVIFILVVLFLPGGPLFRPSRVHAYAPRIQCVNNLKEVGLAYRMWSDDHNDMYPMRVLTNQAGVLLFADATNGFRYFQVMSNELDTPKVLVCPADKRIAATNFTTDLSGAHLSYFIGLEADQLRPGGLLSGDRNIVNGRKPINGILEVEINQNIGWSAELHNGSGDVGLADGSVQQLTSNGLAMLVRNTGLATNRILLPP
jgi:hypothetical protein